MPATVEPLFVRRGRSKISSSPLLVDANNDGWPEIFVGGPVLRGFAWDGTALPGWPRRAPRPFASSPAFGDISGDCRGSLVVGSDDGSIEAFHVDGERLSGWPVSTGSDVFSTPALADTDGDGRAEVIVGSDDGRIYAIRGDGTVSSAVEVPNRPFVSASPTVLEAESGKGHEIAIGAWDRGLYLIRPQGHGGPVPLAKADHIIWSSATAFTIQGFGRCLAFAADRVYLLTVQGTALPGWPRRTDSWMASSPMVAELEPGAGPRVAVGSDRLYLWDVLGHLEPGWPQACGDFVWASPICFDINGDNVREVVAASWDGRIYAFHPDGSILDGFPLWAGGALFATPCAAPLPSGGGLLVSAAWDGSVRGWRLPRARFAPGDWLQFRGDAARTGSVRGVFSLAKGDPASPDLGEAPCEVERARTVSWAEGHGLQRIEIEKSNGPQLRRGLVEYTISGNRQVHLAPVVQAKDGPVAIVQALRMPHRIRYHVSYLDAEGNVDRWPTTGETSFISVPIWARGRPQDRSLGRHASPPDASLPSPGSEGSAD